MDEYPTAQTAQFKVRTVRTGSQTQLSIPAAEFKPQKGFLFVGLEYTAADQSTLSCGGFVVGLVNHFQRYNTSSNNNLVWFIWFKVIAPLAILLLNKKCITFMNFL